MEFQRVNIEKKDGEEKKNKQSFFGVVVSDKMDKTIVVSVSTVKMDPKYKKRYRRDKRYKVHDEKNQFKNGDKVTFVSCRPFSKDKRWEVVS